MTSLFALKKTLEEYWHAAYDRNINKDKETIPFFKKVRGKGHTLFLNHGLPSHKSEIYRYTPIIQGVASLSEQGMKLPEDVREKVPLPPLLRGIEGEVITLYNGYLQPCDQGKLPYHISSLHQGYQSFPEHFHAHFNTQASTVQDGWVELHNMFFKGGAFLYIPPHLHIEKPIIIHHHISSKQALACYPRLLLVMSPCSRATVIETFSTTALSSPGFVNRVAECVLARESHLTYYPLQVSPSSGYHLRYMYVQQREKSLFEQHLVAASEGDACVRDELTVSLQEEGARAALHGLYRTSQQQHLAIHTTVHHQSPHTATQQHYKGVVQDRGSSLFDGSVFIAPKAEKTVASQQHKGWLLSDEATLYARPQLFIKTDDVQCSHGVTTSKIDPTLITYMRTRGIPESLAEKILLQGFFNKEIEQIPHHTIRGIAKKLFY